MVRNATVTETVAAESRKLKPGKGERCVSEIKSISRRNFCGCRFLDRVDVFGIFFPVVDMGGVGG